MADNVISNQIPSSNSQIQQPSQQQKVNSVIGGGTPLSAASKHHHHHHHHHHNNQQQHPNEVKINSGKHNINIIHRTTSESLRVGGGGGNGNSSVSSETSPASTTSSGSGSGATAATGGGGGTTSTPSTTMTTGSSSSSSINRKTVIAPAKTSSFQITSVTVGTCRMSGGDNGEDSADDLDESHTDDNSRITDLENETPSISEDTSFSKEDVFFSNNPLGTAPVIPTSSQYGLAIVTPPDGSGLHNHHHHIIADMQLSVTDGNIVNIVGGQTLKPNDGDGNHRNERFKVVKIESTEPFKRGRWMCMDYLDHTTLQQSAKDEEGAGGGGNGNGGNEPSSTTSVTSNQNQQGKELSS